MNTLRIHITGASGSGTTTLGCSLAQNLGLTFLDADHYYWLPTVPPFMQKRSGDERLSMLRTDIKGGAKGFVLSGSICGWDPALENCFDLIVFLSIPPDLRLDRLRRREIERYGVVNPEFIEWASRYDEGGLDVRSRKRHELWLADRNCAILRLEGDLSNNKRMNLVLRHIQKCRSIQAAEALPRRGVR